MVKIRIQLFNSPSPGKDLDLYECGYEDCSSDFNYGPHVRDVYLIHYIVKGSGSLIKGDLSYKIGEGDIFTIFPGEVTCYKTVKEDPWSFYWFSFNGGMGEEYAESTGLSREKPVKQIGHLYNIPEHIDKMIQALSVKEDSCQCKVLSYLYLTLSRLQDCNADNGQKAAKKKRTEEYIENAMRFIEHNYFKEITVEKIAGFSNLERTYFSKLFKKVTGISPRDYLIKFRIEKAAEFIRNTDLEMKSIAKCVGIYDEYYFSRAFKKIKGKPPGKYRRSL